MSDSRPRVLHCVSHLGLGGAERVAINIIQLLDTKFEFGVFAVQGRSDGETGRSLATELNARSIFVHHGHRVPMRWGGMLSGAVSLARAIRLFRPDLIHLHTEIPEACHAVLVAACPLFARIPVIRSIHNSVIWSFSPGLGRWCDRRLSQAYCIAVSRGAVRAITQLRRESRADPLPEPPVVIYNAVSPAPQPSEREIAREGPVRLLFGGRFEAEKGADLLPHILPRVRLPPGRTAHLTIYGQGRYDDRLTLLRQAPPAGWTIEIHPPTSRFREGFTHYDLCLMPSRFEGLPLVALETALADLPIVATTAPGLIEALPLDHRWLASPGDAADFAAILTQALHEPQRWPTVAQSTRTFVEQKFNLTKMAEAHTRLYWLVLAKAG